MSMADCQAPSNAKPWYETAFGADYLKRYAHRNRAEAAAVVGVVASRVPMEGARVLDLACGGGRHISPLLAQGTSRVVGLDLSAGLLRAATELLQPELKSGRVELVQGDMRALPFEPETFDVVGSFFTSFGYFDDQADDARVFAEIARVLTPGGYFAIDFLNAPVAIDTLVADETRYEDQPGSDPIAVTIRRTYDAGRRRLEKCMTYPDGSRRFESVRAYTADELAALGSAQGFELIETLGGYDGSPFDESTSERALLIFRKPA